jgi:hypothetical protein
MNFATGKVLETVTGSSSLSSSSSSSYSFLPSFLPSEVLGLEFRPCTY